MSIKGEGFEHHSIPNFQPELAAFLEAYADIDPATVLSLPHIPRLIGGLKSNEFIIRDQEASPDMPPDPDARIDLSKVVVEVTAARNGLAAFAAFSDKAEAQADSQYDIALFETQQLAAEATGRGVDAPVLFVPGVVNSSAKDYFRRLTRLAQDTGMSVATRIVDHDDGEVYEYFQRFDPIKASNAADYWEQRANEHHANNGHPIRLSGHAVYTLEGAYNFNHPPAADVIAGIAIPTIRPPFVFTSFEQVQKDYPNSPISDPKVWAAHKDDYELVGDDAEYARLERARRTERDNLRDNMRHTACLTTKELRQLFLGEDAPFADKVPVIRELAVAPGDWNASARMILAKLGDKQSVQQILQEIEDETKTSGYRSLTTAPLGIHLRHDDQLFNQVVSEVKDTIAEIPEDPGKLLTLLGALYHSHDARLGMLFASHLTVPTHTIEAYAKTVLHASARWLPEYTYALAFQPQSHHRSESLQAIESQAAAFMDAHNRGELEGVRRHMVFSPDNLLPLLFWFDNPAHQPILMRSVMRQFREGGSIITDQTFERTYLLYRERYGDLPEISRHIRS